MSDAQSDIGRDRLRAKMFEEFLRSLVQYLKDPTGEKFESVRVRAKATDDVVGGYKSGPTHIERKLADSARKLLAGDKTEWEMLLAAAEDFDSFEALCRLIPLRR